MAALEFKFSSDQQHQLEAIEATCDLFRGQQFASSVFSADSGRKGQTAIGELMVGHGNELRVAPGQLLDNLHSVQEDGCLPATDVLTDGRLRDFTVEVDAFERHLVKGICVDSIKAEANLNGAYVRLESVKSNPFSAKVSIDVRQTDGTQKRKVVIVKTGADLYQKSGENSDYENGWVVSNIGAAEGGAAEGDEFIEFQNGEVLEVGEALGDVNEESAAPSRTTWPASSSCGRAA